MILPNAGISDKRKKILIWCSQKLLATPCFVFFLWNNPLNEIQEMKSHVSLWYSPKRMVRILISKNYPYIVIR